ncbi:stress response protein YvgO [Calothrix parasitica NIES-267]|uniref:Stress response protein YvgO n=1 Tax=Calothrix parasitica NIES-267 TaxID=1973488 RepID=A0A1Z4LTV9_9CYAN|nr:stress response protein YvgO [Calothrix parasitica NIES-267]
MTSSSKKLTIQTTITKKILLAISLFALVINSLILSPLPAHADRVAKKGELTKLYNTIIDDISTIGNRDACVKAILETASSRVGKTGNVMVFNLSQDYKKNLKNWTFNQFRCAGTRYGLWTFTSGTFINKGDGGYINWGFSGKYRRTGTDGKTVKFYPKTKKSTRRKKDKS